MPIVSSRIKEEIKQEEGRRQIIEEHIDSTGEKHFVNYTADEFVDIENLMKNRVEKINEYLVEKEINEYLYKISNGENVIGLVYTETTQKQRVNQFLIWVKEKFLEGDFQTLKYAYQVIDQFTEEQIDELLDDSKGKKVKILAEKIKAMNQAMDDSLNAVMEV